MKRNILAIIGSASKNSANLKLVNKIVELTKTKLKFEIFDRLAELPHFNPELSIERTPEKIEGIRQSIFNADGIIICTPEYVFSIPSGLKNLIEWCVSTTVFSQKPLGIITASAQGEKGHEELKLIIKTLEAKFTDETTLLVQGVKGKIDGNGNIINPTLLTELYSFTENFKKFVNENAVQR